MRSALAAVIAACALCGCGSGATVSSSPRPIPIALGVGRAYRPASLSRATAAGRTVRDLSCTHSSGARFGAFLELIAYRRVILIPAGVGIAPPRREAGAYVDGGRCYYPLLTHRPTGVVELRDGARASLGDLFALWGEPLSPTRLGAFRAPVRVYLGGRRFAGDPRTVPLRRHATVVIEIGAYIRPHSTYAFPPGL